MDIVADTVLAPHAEAQARPETKGSLRSFWVFLLSGRFAVFLTSDHGNIETGGSGRPSEGVVADVRDERVWIHSDAVLASRVRSQFPDPIAWPAIGLPDDCVVLLAPTRSAFVREGDRIVGHEDHGTWGLIPRQSAEALTTFERLASDSEFGISFQLERGEAVVFSNCAMVHNRTSFEDYRPRWTSGFEIASTASRASTAEGRYRLLSRVWQHRDALVR